MDIQILVNIGNQTIPIYINRQTSIYQIKNCNEIAGINTIEQLEQLGKNS